MNPSLFISPTSREEVLSELKTIPELAVTFVNVPSPLFLSSVVGWEPT